MPLAIAKWVVPAAFLAWLTGGCGPAPEADANLTDRQFAEILMEATRLRRRWGSAPDSVAARTDSLLRARGVSRKALEAFLQVREEHPERWVPVLEAMLGAADSLGTGITRRRLGK